MCALLGHLELDGTCLERPAGVKIILRLHKMLDAEPRASQFILAVEETQKKLVQEKLPVLDNLLAAFATSIILYAYSFPHNHPICDGKPAKDQPWPAWKYFFKPHPAGPGAQDGGAIGPA